MAQRNSRQQRVATQMQRTLAELLPRAVKDPRVGRVTITGVSLLEDFSSARVWFLPFGKSQATDEQLAGLQSAAGFLRGELARQLGLRHAPRLEFRLDTAQEQAHALSSLIESAVSRDRRLGGATTEQPDAETVDPDPEDDAE